MFTAVRATPFWAVGRPVSSVRQYAVVRPAKPGGDLRAAARRADRQITALHGRSTAADRVENAFEADACVIYGVATSESSYRFSNRTGGKNVRVVTGPDNSSQLVEILSPDGRTKLIVKKSTYEPPFFASERPRYGDCHVRIQHLESGQVVTLAENTELLGNILVDFTIRPVGEVLLPFIVKGVPDI
jgi:hypothetical protein